MEAARTSETLVNFYLHGATTQKTAIFVFHNVYFPIEDSDGLGILDESTEDIKFLLRLEVRTCMKVEISMCSFSANSVY
jgi:hypothetical protein